MKENTIALAEGVLTRVGYADVPIPAELVGLTSDSVSSLEWAKPVWAEDGQIRFGAAAWVADISGCRIVLDPILAADAFLRSDPETESAQQDAIYKQFKSSGFPADSVDIVLMSHIEGVGATAHRSAEGNWSPFFPNAKLLVSDIMLNTFQDATPSEEEDIERDAWCSLIDQGLVDTFTDGEEIKPGLMAEVSGGHCPGHTVFHFNLTDNPIPAAFLGHLAVSPIHLATGPCAGMHENADAANNLLHSTASKGGILIGPLWPAPGFGQWHEGELI